MKYALPVLLLCAAVSVAQVIPSAVPRLENMKQRPGLPVGTWRVEFTNGVVESCGIGNGGEASVDEPRRQSMGTAVAEGGSVVITFYDDRLERWTPVGGRYVVEHWFPGSRLPTVTPVLGIAERAR